MISFDDVFTVTAVFFLAGYIDAGTGSLIIQTLIGFLAGALLMLKIFWSKIKARFKKPKDAAKGKNISGQENLLEK